MRFSHYVFGVVNFDRKGSILEFSSHVCVVRFCRKGPSGRLKAFIHYNLLEGNFFNSFCFHGSHKASRKIVFFCEKTRCLSLRPSFRISGCIFSPPSVTSWWLLLEHTHYFLARWSFRPPVCCRHATKSDVANMRHFVHFLFCEFLVASADAPAAGKKIYDHHMITCPAWGGE